MASYYMRINPVTPIREIQAKLDAFKLLYGDVVTITAKGHGILTTRKHDGIIFPITSVDVIKIGRQYITIQLSTSEGHELFLVNMKNPNHGITELLFLTK